MKEKNLELIKNFDKLPSGMHCRKDLVLSITSWSRATLHRRIKSGYFPNGEYKLGNKVPTWTVETIRQALTGNLSQFETNFECSSSNLKLQHNKNTFEKAKTLLYPPKFSQEEIEISDSLLVNFDQQLAQQLLDEIQGNIELKTIKRSPISLLTSLCKRASSGDFTPALGLIIKKKREEAQSLIMPKPRPKKTIDLNVIEERLKKVRQSLTKNQSK